MHSYETPRDVERGVNEWCRICNAERPHSSLGDATPDEVYFAEVEQKDEAVS